MADNGKFKKGSIPWNKGRRIQKICITCGKSFTTILSRQDIKRCSFACRKNGEWRTCKCGIKFYVSLPSQDNIKSCSTKCGHVGYRPSKQVIEKLSKLSKSKSGENHYNWKGGKYSENYRDRRKFRDVLQKQVFERDDYTCQMCGLRGVNLQVDHIQPWSEYIELRFCIDNCRTLCANCHYTITFGKPMPPTVRAWGQNMFKGGSEQ